MTKQEALKELSSLNVNYGRRSYAEVEKLNNAINMAIKALKNSPIPMSGTSDLGGRKFEQLLVRDINRKPYYEIKYIDENGDSCVGYSSYRLDVISQYLKTYFGLRQDDEPVIQMSETSDQVREVTKKTDCNDLQTETKYREYINTLVMMRMDNIITVDECDRLTKRLYVKLGRYDNE